jgi:hypothetical protein
MKKYIYILLAAICLSVITGCQNSDLPTPTNDPNKRVKVTQKMLFVGYTPYAKILNHDGEKIGYIATKQNSIDEAEMSFVLPSTFDRSFDYETNGNAAPPKQRHIGFAVNGAFAKELATNLVKPNRQFFGTNVNFSVFKDRAGGMMKSPGEGEPEPGDAGDDEGKGGITISMYVPELLHITSPNIENPEDLLPYCYYDNFVLGWNADPQNENGLVVVVEWNGTDLYGNEYKEYVRSADIIKNDNGSCVLNNALFDGIPHGALVNIQLIRGNIDVEGKIIHEDGSEEYFVFVAASQAILPIILVREIQ